MPETPHCLAMVVCDHVYRDPASHRFTIVGTFNELTSPSFPARLNFSLYFATTGGHGSTHLKLRLIHTDVLLSGEGDDVVIVLPSIDIKDPLAIWESSFTITGTFHTPGQYHCELYANDELLMMRRLTLHDARSKG